jgi:hypothetical protein
MHDDLEKMAQLFEQRSKDMFGTVSYHEEAKQLSLLSGKLSYRLKDEPNIEKKRNLLEAARLVLEAADMLKKV